MWWELIANANEQCQSEKSAYVYWNLDKTLSENKNPEIKIKSEFISLEDILQKVSLWMNVN